MNYQKASQFWLVKEKDVVSLEKKKLLERIEKFILSHNTLALATGYDGEVRSTPVEYNYYDGFFYIFSEGGLKFKYLEKNKNVSACIFDSYTGFCSIHSLQIKGHCHIIAKEDEEYDSILVKKGLDKKALEKMKVEFYIIKIIPERYDFLDSSLKKEGFSNRQHYIF